ncbi:MULTISPECIES: hypothetical protein [Pseudomonadota]|uniref:Uncharacterized protein n=1 Tax=Rhodanobacter denitrificans TaxID=666685 RepID=M4NN19_9GAMM|nr:MULTISPECIES: hypothetical protein [Pseudomonadota]AGG89086.1 hypothetical protein R2APBS1_1963 [Rhodanobacter denitrificans]TAN25157.1 MAG: hypothetical protein EPN31_15870 [Castellaniella sp.]UJJ53113.1 hypothetical protein LRK52_18580 [Rhodanobacter denitrificans]
MLPTTSNLPESPAGDAGAHVRKVCPHCGSDDVMRTATMVWDVATQDWIVSSLHDDGAACNACNREEIELAVETVDVGATSPAGSAQDKPQDTPDTVPYTAESYTAFPAGGRHESGWCVKCGDDTVCDVVGGQGDAERIAALLNAAALTTAAGGDAAAHLPDLNREAQAIALGTLRLIDLQLREPPSPKMLVVMRQMVRCALGDYTVDRELACEQLASAAYRRTYDNH